MEFPYRVGAATPLFLAPMAGVSEAPFRQVCRRFGADVVVTEFISSVGVSRGIERVLADGRFEAVERPIGIQLYGAEADTMARAAEMVTGLFQPDFIDINFGCPVKKVVRNNGGSGCLKDLGLVQQIIRAVRGATHLPVTVKIRSGWDETQRDPVTIALRCREAGAQALTLHARTRTQMFTGNANWDEIARVVEALDVPVIGNGDVNTAADVLATVRVRQSVDLPAGPVAARGAAGGPRTYARGAFRDGAGACALGAAPPGRQPQDGARVPQALRVVHEGRAGRGAAARAALPDRVDD